MTDLLTDDEARIALGRGLTDSSKAPLLTIAIGAVTAKIEERFGPVVYGTITGELHNGGGNVVYLDYRPVVSVVQVVEYDGTTAGTLTAESNTSKPASAYWLNEVNGRLVRRSGNADALYPFGRDNIYVTYVAGRCQGTLIPDKWKLAAALTLKNAWRAWENSAAQVGEYEIPQAQFPTFTIPRAVDELLAAETQLGSGTGG